MLRYLRLVVLPALFGYFIAKSGFFTKGQLDWILITIGIIVVVMSLSLILAFLISMNSTRKVG